MESKVRDTRAAKNFNQASIQPTSQEESTTYRLHLDADEPGT
jgi:hypothetical protein